MESRYHSALVDNEGLDEEEYLSDSPYGDGASQTSEDSAADYEYQASSGDEREGKDGAASAGSSDFNSARDALSETSSTRSRELGYASALEYLSVSSEASTPRELSEAGDTEGEEEEEEEEEDVEAAVAEIVFRAIVAAVEREEGSALVVRSAAFGTVFEQLEEDIAGVAAELARAAIEKALNNAEEEEENAALRRLPPMSNPRGIPALPPRPSASTPRVAPAGGAAAEADTPLMLRGAPTALPTSPRGIPALPSKPSTIARRRLMPPSTSAIGEIIEVHSSSSGGGGSAAPAAPATPLRHIHSATPAAAAAGPPAALSFSAASEITPEESESVQKLRITVQSYRIDVFRTALRLGYPVHDTLLEEVMVRLAAVERIHLGSATPAQGSADEALADARRAEAVGHPLEFSCTVMVLGMAGGGKTAMLRSLFEEEPLRGYHPTDEVEVLRGAVNGLRVTFIDTPGLKPGADQVAANLRTLRAAKRAWDKDRPSAVLYVSRMDQATRDSHSEYYAMQSITDVFGAEIWPATILTLTHANAPIPDANDGLPEHADTYLHRRRMQLQDCMRIVAENKLMLNQVALVESDLRFIGGGAALCGPPGPLIGLGWRRQLLMRCFDEKAFTEVRAALKPASVDKERSRGGFLSFPLGQIELLLARLTGFNKPQKPTYIIEQDITKLDYDISRLPAEEKSAARRKKRQLVAHTKLMLKDVAEQERLLGHSGPVFALEPELDPSFDPDLYSQYRWGETAGSLNYVTLARELPNAVRAFPLVATPPVDHEDAVKAIKFLKQSALRLPGQVLGGIPYLATCEVGKDMRRSTIDAQLQGSVFHSSSLTSTATVDFRKYPAGAMILTTQAETQLRTNPSNKISVGAIACTLAEDYTRPYKKHTPWAYGFKLDDRLKIAPDAKVRASIGRILSNSRVGGFEATRLSTDMHWWPIGDPSTLLVLAGSTVLQGRRRFFAGAASVERKLPSKAVVAVGMKGDSTGSKGVGCNLHMENGWLGLWAIAGVMLKAIWDTIF